MKKCCLLAFCCLLGWQSVAQTVAFDSSNLPIVKLITNGQAIPDHPRIVAKMQIVDNGVGATNRPTDPPLGYDGWITIETRGSTSQVLYPKKSYGLTTIVGPSDEASLNVPLLGFPEENDWVLYAPYSDKTMVRNALAFDLARKMGRYASRVRFVELLLNNEYMGVYCLQEKIKRDADRVDVSRLQVDDVEGDQLTGGYILKIDKITGNTGPGWISTLDPKLFFLHHYPDEEDLAPQQLDYIRDFVNAFEYALQNIDLQDTLNGYRQYINAASFVDFFILQELGRTVDGFRSSTFFYKDRDSKGGRLTMGPMWDFNLSYGNANYCGGDKIAGWQHRQNDICNAYYPRIPFWWQQLLSDPWFAQHLQCRWTQLRSSTLHLDSLYSIIDRYTAELNIPQQRNYVRWPILGIYVDWNPFIGQTYSDEVEYMKDWVANRIGWLDAQWLTGADCAVSVVESVPAPFRLFPNPARDGFWLDWPVAGKKHLRVFDGLGKLIHDVRTADVPIRVECPRWPPGVYFFTIQNERGQAARGKFSLH